MRTKAYCFLVLWWLPSAIIAANIPANRTPNGLGPDVVTNVGDRSERAPDMPAMIATWPHGNTTNGLFCAIQFYPPSGVIESETYCTVYVANTTSNDLHAFLRLPPQALFRVSLIDTNGKPVDAASLGESTNQWTESAMTAWLDEQNRLRSNGRYFSLHPFGYAEVENLPLGKLFQLKHPGEYTLHLTMLLVKNNPDAAGNTRLTNTVMPEVVAKIQILPQDIPQAAGIQNTNTNAVPK